MKFTTDSHKVDHLTTLFSGLRFELCDFLKKEKSETLNIIFKLSSDEKVSSVQKANLVNFFRRTTVYEYPEKNEIGIDFLKIYFDHNYGNDESELKTTFAVLNKGALLELFGQFQRNKKDAIEKLFSEVSQDVKRTFEVQKEWRQANAEVNDDFSEDEIIEDLTLSLDQINLEDESSNSNDDKNFLDSNNESEIDSENEYDVSDAVIDTIEDFLTTIRASLNSSLAASYSSAQWLKAILPPVPLTVPVGIPVSKLKITSGDPDVYPLSLPSCQK